MQKRPWSLLKRPSFTTMSSSLGDVQGVRTVQAQVQDGEKPAVPVALQIETIQRASGSWLVEGQLAFPDEPNVTKAFNGEFGMKHGDGGNIWIED